MLFLLKRTFWMYYYECKIINKSTILVKQNKEGSESGQAYTTAVNYSSMDYRKVSRISV